MLCPWRFMLMTKFRFVNDMPAYAQQIFLRFDNGKLDLRTSVHWIFPTSAKETLQHDWKHNWKQTIWIDIPNLQKKSLIISCHYMLDKQEKEPGKPTNAAINWWWTRHFLEALPTEVLVTLLIVMPQLVKTWPKVSASVAVWQMQQCYCQSCQNR